MIGKNRFIKKLLSLFLSAAVIGGTAIALPAAVQEGTVTASAASAQVPEGYIGISTPEEFMSITDAPSKNYILLNDLDMSDTAPDGLLHGYIPDFSGILNGNGHTVSNLHCERNSELQSYFILKNTGTVTDLVFKDLYVESSSYSQKNASFIYENEGTVSNIVVDNIIRYSEETCNYTNRSFVAYNSGTLRNIRISTSEITDNGILCYSNSNLIDGCSAFNTPDSSSYNGSMVYSNYSKGTVKNSFCVIPAGYLVYRMRASYTLRIKKFDGRGRVNSENKQYYGRVSHSSIVNSYCVGKAIVGVLDGSIDRCCCFGGIIYEDSDTSYTKDWKIQEEWYNYKWVPVHFSRTDVVKVTSCYTKTSSKKVDYSKLDFVDTWEIAPDGSRPQLKSNREITVTDLKITKQPTKTVYNAGDNIVASGAITVTCSNGKTAVVAITASMLSGYDMNKAGKQKVRIDYAGGTGYYEITVEPIRASAISLSETSIKLKAGDTYDSLKATITPENVTDKTVTWASADKSVATVDKNGKITAVGKGTTVITASTENGKTAKCSVTVYLVPKRVRFERSQVTMVNGTVKSLKATVYPIEAENKTLTWTSSDPDIASVSEDGDVTAKRSGTASITAETFNGITASCTVTVVTKPDSVSLDHDTVTVVIGESVVLTPRVLPVDADNRSVTWKTADKTIATVTEGVVKGIKRGETTVTAKTVNGKTAECTVRVVVAPSKVVMSKSSLTLINGTTKTLNAAVYPSVAENKSLTWTSSDEKVVVVDENGILTPRASGMAVITAKTFNGLSAKCTVKVVTKPSSVTLNKTTASVDVGKSIMLEAKVLPSNADNRKVTWKTSDSRIATVSGGAVKGIKAGTVTIRAKAVNGKTAICKVTVNAVPTKLVLSSKAVTMINGTTKTLKATVYPSKAANKTVTWTSSDSTVASVSAEGVITAKGSGTAVITAKTFNGITASCTVKVVTKPSSISLDKSETEVEVGKSIALTATVLPANADNKTVKWTTSDSRVATVSDGIVKGIKTGTVTITARTVNGKTAVCTVTVNAVPTKLVLSSKAITMINGTTKTLKVTVYPSNAANKTITWTSSDRTVATVSDDGVITANGSGTAVITAKTFNGITASCTVKVVTKPSSVSLDKTEAEVEVGKSISLTATVLPANADNKTVTWKTSDSRVATVSGGVVKGINTGTVTITAKTVNGKTAICRVTVKEPVILPTSVKLSSTSISMNKGEKTSLTATVTPSNATDKALTWTTSDSKVVTVDNGNITAVGAGTATITVTTSNGRSASCTVKVIPAIESLRLMEKSVTLSKNSSYVINGISCTPYSIELDNSELTWKSSNPAVATVVPYLTDSAVVKGISNGTTVVTVTSKNGVSTKLTVYVKDITRQLVYKDNDIRIYYTGLGSDSLHKVTMKFDIENNTPYNLTFQVRNFSVNGYMVNHVFSSDVAAYMKISDSIGLRDLSMAQYGIDKNNFSTSSFNFYIFSWKDNIRFESSTITVGKQPSTKPIVEYR